MSKARILAVDDQRYFRDLVEGLLRDAGYAVQTAASGDEALHLLEQQDFDVVITDLVMPGIDGRELTRLIKERLADQEVVVVSGVVDVTAAIEAMKFGATEYILKPFDGEDLCDCIVRILERRRLRKEHARLLEENLTSMLALATLDRGVQLFEQLALEPLAEHLIENLCAELRCQSGVAWFTTEVGGDTLELAGARGLIEVGEDRQTISWPEFLTSIGPDLSLHSSVAVSADAETSQGESVYFPLRFKDDLVGMVQVADELDDEGFSRLDRSRAERLCQLGATAVRNALRLRGVERRTLRDPETHAYTQDYFEDTVRNEIQKANRFGHRFSILRVQLEANPASRINAESSLEFLNQGLEERALVVESSLRATDLLASSGPHDYSVLLPQTDALGAGILAQRIRIAVSNMSDARIVAQARVSAATFPVDGTQLEDLWEVAEDRLERAGESLLARRPEFARPQSLNSLFDRMLELGSVEHVDVEGQILKFVLDDVIRRPADRGVLFVSPGSRWHPDVLESLREMRGRNCQTEIVVIAEAEEPDVVSGLTWATKSSLDVQRPLLVYFGDGPAFALIGQVTLAAERTPIFQTSDRFLVEHLAFELQRELGILISV